MKQAHRLGWWLLAVFVAAVVCGPVSAADQPSEKDQAKIKANLAKLPAKDRKLAQQQKYCAIEEDNLLGAMGVPIKVMVKGEPVFLCCKGCKKDALAHPDETLAKVKALREKNKNESSQ